MPIRTQLRGATARLLLVLVLLASSAATGLSPADAPVGSPASVAAAKDGKKHERARDNGGKRQDKKDGKGNAKDKKRRGKGAKAALNAQKIAAANADDVAALACGPDLIALRVAGRTFCTHGEDPEPPAGEFVREGETAAEPEPEIAAESTGAAPRALCIDDGVSGPRVQMVYVHRQDRPNRLDELLPTFRRLAAETDLIFDQSARKTGGSLRLRFVTDANCRVDIQRLAVSDNAIGGFGSLMQKMAEAGYDALDRKYLMMVDASVFCGVGTFAGADAPDTQAHDFTGYARVDLPCWDAGSMAHEISHTLGAVQYSAPNTSRGAHCIDEWDVMCYSDEPFKPKMRDVCTDGAQDFRLDCGNDDYYAARPKPGSYLTSHWNMADSQYLTTGSGPVCVDARYEPDDAFWYDFWSVPMPAFPTGHDQQRAFCSEPGDADWALIRAKAGETYRIETSNLAQGVDTRMILYRGFEEQRWDGMVEFAVNDDRAEGDPSSAITFTAPANGSFLVGIAEVEGRAGFDQTYTLAIDKVGATPAPPLSLSRSSGKPGVAFTATVRELNAQESVTFRRQRNGQSVWLGEAAAGADGTASATFTVPRGWAKGTHQIEAVTDNRSAATAPFTVLDAKDGKKKGKGKGKDRKPKRGGKGKRR